MEIQEQTLHHSQIFQGLKILEVTTLEGTAAGAEEETVILAMAVASSQIHLPQIMEEATAGNPNLQ